MNDTRASAEDCPIAPPAFASVYVRTLHRACLIVGGIAALARELDVPAGELERWLRAEEDPPEAVFLHAVEVLLLYASDAGVRPT